MIKLPYIYLVFLFIGIASMPSRKHILAFVLSATILGAIGSVFWDATSLKGISFFAILGFIAWAGIRIGPDTREFNLDPSRVKLRLNEMVEMVKVLNIYLKHRGNPAIPFEMIINPRISAVFRKAILLKDFTNERLQSELTSELGQVKPLTFDIAAISMALHLNHSAIRQSPHYNLKGEWDWKGIEGILQKLPEDMQQTGMCLYADVRISDTEVKFSNLGIFQKNEPNIEKEGD